MSISRAVSFIRIDPYRRHVARVVLKGKDFKAPVRRSIKATNLGWMEIMQVEEKRLTMPVMDKRTKTIVGQEDHGPTPLIVMAAAEISKGVPGFILGPQKDSTAGLAVLFGQGIGGSAVDCPVTLEWVQANITWLTAEEADQDREEAEAAA